MNTASAGAQRASKKLTEKHSMDAAQRVRASELDGKDLAKPAHTQAQSKASKAMLVKKVDA